MDPLRSKLIRLAAELPKNDPTRREILSALKYLPLDSLTGQGRRQVGNLMDETLNVSGAMSNMMDLLQAFQRTIVDPNLKDANAKVIAALTGAARTWSDAIGHVNKPDTWKGMLYTIRESG